MPPARHSIPSILPNVSWEPKGPFYIFEFFREKEQKIPPTRYVNTANKAYTFTSDPRGAVVMFNNAFKIEKKKNKPWMEE